MRFQRRLGTVSSYSRPSKRYMVSGVYCRTCGTFVTLHSMDRLPHEFTVRCPQCGQRGYYSRAELIETNEVRAG